jgi:P-type Ca2+ transporter type 2C
LQLRGLEFNLGARMADSDGNDNWHHLSFSDVLGALGCDDKGLSAEQAAERLERFGPNELPDKPPPPFWLVFIRQFNNPLIYILAAAAVFSIGVGEFTDAGFIGAVMLLNALIGGVQEWRAEKASRALQKLIITRASVVRDGEVLEMAASEVVPGDVVLLESGRRVPADMRLLTSHGLEADESLLTGESLPVAKDPRWEGPENAPPGDRLNMCYAGSVIARGRGRGLVVATGQTTAVGRMALEIASRAAGKPPLLIRLERFTRMIGIAVLAAALLIVLLGVLFQGHSWHEMFVFGVALAVSAIPEGLPVTLTVVLAIATHRMARRGVMVRKLAAVEGLGSCTMIASDKTGTLTANELTVQHLTLPGGRVLRASGIGYSPEGEIHDDGAAVTAESDEALSTLLRAGALCNEGSLHRAGDHWAWHGDPTDVALLALAHKGGLKVAELESRWPLINQIPFEPERQYAATFHEQDGAPLVCVKGAPERVLDMCRWDDATEHARLSAEAAALAEQGFRVLGVAEGEQPGVDERSQPAEPSGLRFLGFVGMIDPLRDGVKQAIQDCRKAGIKVAMVTGDHPVTALAIARQLSMAEARDEVMTGTELEELDDDTLKQRMESTIVFARTNPQQKLRIVEAARQTGHFVAVTGDGVNDAPALRAASIGVAMGRSGTDVAREAAELVISDDNFATIVAGVEEGRIAYDNLRKVICQLVSTGSGEVCLVLLAVGTGNPLPLLPVQVLWLNLVANGIQDKALAFEPGEGDVLERKPRRTDEAIFNRIMIERIALSAAVMGGMGFLLFVWLLDSGVDEDMARNIVLLQFVLFENVHIGNSRSETRSLFTMSPFKNPLLLVCVGGAFLLHLTCLYLPPAQAVLGTAPVGLDIWLIVLAIALVLPAAVELHKLYRRLRPIV